MKFENIVIEKIEIDVGKGRITDKPPMVIKTQTLVNNTDYEQTMLHKLSQSVTHTSSFEPLAGYMIKAGARFRGEQLTSMFLIIVVIV